MVGFDWTLFLAKIAWTAALVSSLTSTSIASAFCGAAIFSFGASSIEEMLSKETILTVQQILLNRPGDGCETSIAFRCSTFFLVVFLGVFVGAG